MIERSAFTATVDGGTVAGWVVGDGRPVLLLHGGPGLRYDYMEPLIVELQTDFRVAIFQQRGLEPSTLEGPFTIAQAIESIIRGGSRQVGDDRLCGFAGKSCQCPITLGVVEGRILAAEASRRLP